MLRTKNLITSISEVPSNWVYEYYLNLDSGLSSDLNIRSIFNAGDNTPSMYIYYCPTSNQYKFKDFSTGKSGTCVGLVMELFNISSYHEAMLKVMADYRAFLSQGGKSEAITPQMYQRYKLSDYQCRNWTVLDASFWTSFKISSELLSEYNVIPLEKIVLSRTLENNVLDTITIQGEYIYGYFTKEGELYKIYQPKSKGPKFLKIKDYVQGLDQLSWNVPYLLITSSLKDLLAIKTLNIKNLDCIAPDSENTLIPKKTIDMILSKGYRKVCTLFDNDIAGRQAIEKYKKEYNFNGVFLDMSKDVSDSLRDFGKKEVLTNLIPLLKNCFAV